MRRAARIDASQPAIVAALERVGAAVVVIGRPLDLLVAHRGETLLMECKDGNLPPSQRPLTPAQKKFLSWWPGRVAVVTNEAEALRAIGIF